MLAVKLDDVDECALSGLVAIGAAESLTLEFKRSLYTFEGPSTRQVQVECLADVSAMANSHGGDIVLGIQENLQGVAVEVVGVKDSIDAKGLDGYVRRIDQLLYAHLDPPLVGVRWRVVPLASGCHVLIGRVPRSLAAPHRVKLGEDKYWIRQERGHTVMDSSTLRALVLGVDLTARLVEEFRAERFGALSSGASFYRDSQGLVVTVHCVPRDAFLASHSLDSQVLISGSINISPIRAGRSPVGRTHCLEGVRFHEGSRWKPGSAMVTVFRNGIVETACCWAPDRDQGARLVRGDWLDKELARSIAECVNLQQSNGAMWPITIVLSALAKANTRLGWYDGMQVRENECAEGAWPDGPFSLPPLVLVEPTSSPESCLRQLRPLLDVLWNSAGYPSVPSSQQLRQ